MACAAIHSYPLVTEQSGTLQPCCYSGMEHSCQACTPSECTPQSRLSKSTSSNTSGAGWDDGCETPQHNPRLLRHITYRMRLVMCPNALSGDGSYSVAFTGLRASWRPRAKRSCGHPALTRGTDRNCRAYPKPLSCNNGLEQHCVCDLSRPRSGSSISQPATGGWCSRRVALDAAICAGQAAAPNAIDRRLCIVCGGGR